jgi:murein L,D-transpeptidase YafK
MSPFALVAALAVVNPPPHCAGRGPHVVVETAEHALFLCEGATEVRWFGVRLSGAAGKTREGDDKVPLGVYPLAAPRRSKAYGTFIPIGYPTPKQQRAGYTGGAVGVHGPDRRVRWLGRLTNLLDTTSGCVGIATDEEMAVIVAWMRKTRAARIEIR